jgi:capsular polysaccharide transport system permease protein
MATELEQTVTTTDSDVLRPPAGRGRHTNRSFAPLRSIVALMLREMATRYGRTPGGYIWAVLEPLGALAVLTVTFSFLIRSPSLGNSFILFYASGYLPFTVYATISAQVQTSIMFSKPLLQYPAVSFIDAILARFVLNLLTSVAVMTIVLFGILQFTEASATLSFGPMVMAIALAALLGLSIGSLNCFLVGMFPVWGNIWGIITRPMFIVAGVIFVFEDLPDRAQDIIWYTPWIHVTGLFRTGVFPTYAPTYVSFPLIALWILIPLFFGLLLLRRHHKDILNR